MIFEIAVVWSVNTEPDNFKTIILLAIIVKDCVKMVHEPATIEGGEPIITSSIKKFTGLILLPDLEQYKKERLYVPAFINSDCSINEFACNPTICDLGNGEAKFHELKP